jgi:UDP-N-acetylglucosamine--N-acetylmuramyl-(pentapeptide) pyrophosphoryl-undecaprenol N-acetylglucosamine transferase
MAFYGINGTGLGHVSRLLNIAREAREILHVLGLGADFRFLTTTEAPQVAWDFPVWKLPSKTVVSAMDTDSAEYAASSQFLISNVMGMMRPELLVMDTMPQGSFGEFVMLRTFCRHAAFINRHKGEAQATDPVHLAHLPLYDLILTPDSVRQCDRYVIPDAVARRNIFTGVIHGFRAEEAMTRDAVRAHFGVAPRQTVIYISAGGGGDRHAEAECTALVDTLSADPNYFLLVGYGPLYRGVKRYARNVIPLTDCDARVFFPGVDVALSAAGYNTYEELLAAGVPTAFYAQVKGMDRQDERVALGVHRGWHHHLGDFDPLTIRETAEGLTTAAARLQIADALGDREQSAGALRAALELLVLHASAPSSPIDLAALYAAAALRAEWPAVARAQGVSGAGSRQRFVSAARRVLRDQGRSSAVVERNAFFEDARQAMRSPEAPPHVGASLRAWLGDAVMASAADDVVTDSASTPAAVSGIAVSPLAAPVVAAFT